MSMLLDKASVSAELSISTKTLDRWVAQGIVPPPLKIGGVVRWKYEDIKACVERMGQSAHDAKEPKKPRGRPRLAV